MENHINKAKALFKKAYFHNWDEGIITLKKILKDSNCDKATALMIFWHGQPNYYYNHDKIKNLKSYENEMYDFLKSIANDILSNKYSSVISYEVETCFIPTELRNIPIELIRPTIGEIEYKEILYPSSSQFDEQIMALCLNCDDVRKMYELENLGADFTLKVNRGYSYPITLACLAEKNEALKYFIEKKYDMNKKYNKRPLFWGAVFNKRISNIKMILENGGQINQKGEFGRNILHEIAGFFADNQEGFNVEIQQIVTFLIEKGADIHALDSDKKTPLELAIMWNNTKFIYFINELQKK